MTQDNFIGEIGVRTFLEALQENASLSEVDLGVRGCFGGEGGHALTAGKRQRILDV